MHFSSSLVSMMAAAAFVAPLSKKIRPCFPFSSSKAFMRSGTARWMSQAADTETTSGESQSMPNWTTKQIRQQFCDYFELHPELPHSFVESSPVAPLNDLTLLFTNAGMNQFKPVFLGQVDPSSHMAKLQRAVNSQKCIRAGGKHNDLEDVGRDNYHHTFFEMLGTWSFGDYFKKEAIDMAWELLTKVYKLPSDRIYATYFGGDEKLGLEPDLEARNYWLNHLPEDKVLACDAKDNFWEMGDTGPCGPCSEVHFDRIGGRNAADLVNKDDPNVLEIWNIVFIQFNRDPGGALSVLRKQHIDTGMGLERLASILQGKTSNYDIDVFLPLFDKLAQTSKLGPYGGLLGEDDVDLRDTAYRAIVDHARALCFALADGAVPNNEGRGYVLRRILRRAMRYGQQILQCPPGFLSELVPVVVNTFGEAYPELVKQQSSIQGIIQEEEQAFSNILVLSIKYFNELQQSKKLGEKKITGKEAFFMYNTFGFPVDLTQLMATEAGLTLDTEGFESEMAEQYRRSREARFANRDDSVPRMELIAEQTAWLADQNIDPTNDEDKYLWLWEDITVARVKAIYTPDKTFMDSKASLRQGDVVGIVLDNSSFYAEDGGQVSDTGTIEFNDEEGNTSMIFEVTDVQLYAGYLLHMGVVKQGSGLKVGDSVVCSVDYNRRRDIAANHLMTHVLNAALRQVLRHDVQQRGSFCNDEKLTFDFSYKYAMDPYQLMKTEELVQKAIRANECVSVKVMPLDEAKAIDGVRAIFGEVYPDPVRVVRVGADTSIEFCGGTHLSYTRDALSFALLEERAVAKGIRRITAVTRLEAMMAHDSNEYYGSLVFSLYNEYKDLQKLSGYVREELEAASISASRKDELRDHVTKLQKEGKEALQHRVYVCMNHVRAKVREALVNNERVLVFVTDIRANAKASQSITKKVKKMAPELAFMGLSEEKQGSGGKVLCFTSVPDSLIEKSGLKADEWVRNTLESIGGRSGGKPSNAQGRAPKCKDIDAILEQGKAYAKQMLESAKL